MSAPALQSVSPAPPPASAAGDFDVHGLLHQLPSRNLWGVGAGLATELLSSRAQGLPLGIEALDDSLPDRGLPRGAVCELAVAGGGAQATSLALAACRAAQRETALQGGEAAWCAFVDPSQTLYAPGVLQAGVELDRLLVVQPPLEALERVTVELVEAHAFPAIVVDLAGLPGSSVRAQLASWVRTVRRLSLGLRETSTTVLLITELAARRALPLPVALRLELRRLSYSELSWAVAKERHGRVAPPRTIAWRPFKPPPALADPSPWAQGTLAATAATSTSTAMGSQKDHLARIPMKGREASVARSAQTNSRSERAMGAFRANGVLGI